MTKSGTLKTTASTSIAAITRKSLALASRQKKEEEAAKQKKRGALLREAIENQSKVCTSLGDATFAAICVGRCIIALKPLIEHGKHQEFVLKYFCEPMQIDLRTTQRYCQLAKDMDALTKRIETGEVIVEDFDERALLRGQGFAEARHLIKQLLNNDSNQAALERTTHLINRN